RFRRVIADKDFSRATGMHRRIVFCNHRTGTGKYHKQTQEQSEKPTATHEWLLIRAILTDNHSRIVSHIDRAFAQQQKIATGRLWQGRRTVIVERQQIPMAPTRERQPDSEPIIRRGPSRPQKDERIAKQIAKKRILS